MRLFATMGLLAVGASATVDFRSIVRQTTLSGMPVVKNAYIVELEAPGGLGRREDSSPHRDLYTALRKRGVSYTVKAEFDSPGLFVGASVHISSTQDLMALASIDSVTSISPVLFHPRPEPVSSYTITSKNDSHLPVDTFSTHVMTGVDKLHAEGLFGAGVKVAVIDTGIDYLHPALGGGFGPGYKVSHGYDFVGDDYTGYNTPVPGGDPLDCAGHGTHVAGIIGANMNEYNFTGVAPSASLGAYRVFGCMEGGGVSDDVMIKAMLAAYSEGNDILALSLGGTNGWSESPTAVVASRIAGAGRIVSVAAGNNGAFGAFYASAPATGQNVISVASVENTQLILQTFTLSNGHAPIAYYSFTPLAIPGSVPIYATSNDTTVTADACLALPASTPDLSGFVVVIKRGGCAFTTKIANVAAKGAKYVLFYNNAAGTVDIQTQPFISTGISQEDGWYLVGQYVAQTAVTLFFPQKNGLANVPNTQGGLTSSFSSFGPSNQLETNMVAAPGGSILSTYLGSSFSVLSGTSMAAPFLSGSAALLLEAHGKVDSTYLTARARFQTTSVPVPSSFTDGDPLQTLAQAGAGLINVYNAVHSQTYVTPGVLALNDTVYTKPIQAITVKNTSNKIRLYNVTHVPAGTMNAFDSNQKAVPCPVPLIANYAQVTFSAKVLAVPPGGTGTLFATIKPPSGVDASLFPIYSGFIRISSSNETVNVPYLGLAAKLKDLKVLDTTDNYFGVSLPKVNNATGDVQLQPTAYTFDNTTADYPILVYRLLAGTRTVQIDLVDSNSTSSQQSRRHLRAQHRRRALTTSHRNSNGLGGEIDLLVRSPPKTRHRVWSWLFHDSSRASGTFAQVPILGTLAQSNYVPRNSNSADAGTGGYNTFALTRPIFANGTTIPNGSYRFLVRALRITGNPTNEADYDVWSSPVVVVAKP